MVLPECSIAEYRVTQFGADCLESLMGLPCPVDAAVLENQLVDT